MPATADQLARFAARHAGPGVIVLPNARDPGSAAVMAEAGFEDGYGPRAEDVAATVAAAVEIDSPAATSRTAGWAASPR